MNSISSVSAHAWRGQEIVLFVTYDFSGDQAKGTLGLPLALLGQTQSVRRSLANNHEQRRTLFTQWRSNQRLSSEFESLLHSISQQVKQDLLASFDTKKFAPSIEKVDLILRNDQVLKKTAPEQRDIRRWRDLTLELHSGQQDALIITFTYPVDHFQKVHKVNLFWQNKSWFVKPTRSPRRQSSDQLYTNKEAPGLIIDRQQITPITFRPHEPEVIWRSPSHIQRLTTTLKTRSAMEGRLAKDSEKRSWGSWLRSFFTQDQEESLPIKSDLFKALHRQIYSAFDHDNDELAYQSLSKVLHGELLDQVFQSTYQALVLKDQGGAQAKVSHVIPLELQFRSPVDIPLPLSQSIEHIKTSLKDHIDDESNTHHSIFYYRWRIVGVVDHWGHTHRRVNDYEAIYLLSKLKCGWRLSYVKPLSQKRRPELEGSL